MSSGATPTIWDDKKIERMAYVTRVEEMGCRRVLAWNHSVWVTGMVGKAEVAEKMVTSVGKNCAPVIADQS